MLAGTERDDSIQGMPPPMRELSTGYPPAAVARNGGGPYPGQAGGYYAGSDYYPSDHESIGGSRRVGGGGGAAGYGRPGMVEPATATSDPRRYNTLQYPGRQYTNRDLGYGRSRNPSGLEYASDTDALQSPVLSVRSARTTALPGSGNATKHNFFKIILSFDSSHRNDTTYCLNTQFDLLTELEIYRQSLMKVAD